MARVLLLAALCAVAVQSVYVDNLSFGHKEVISQDSAEVPGWQIRGEDYQPELLSDRVILTPPYPGNRRGSMWAKEPNPSSTWVAEFQFRASGPDRGSGNLQIWYTKESQAQKAVSSLYTVGQFDGLVLAIDQYGRRGGSIRGFLNDGSISYKDHHNVDSLSFGHCEYAYRNLGRLTNLRITHTSDLFKVEVDNTECFKTEKAKLPPSYYFGISSATGDTPDSFEAHKFLVSNLDSSTPGANSNKNPAEPGKPKVETRDSGAKDTAASLNPSQMTDLNERLQNLNSQMTTVLGELANTRAKMEQATLERYKELLDKVSVIPQQVVDLDRRIQAVERIVTKVQQDIEGRDYKELLSKVHNAVTDTQTNLLRKLPESMSHIVTNSAPRMGYFLFMIIAFQAILFLSYIVYKRRQKNMPKKYL